MEKQKGGFIQFYCHNCLKLASEHNTLIRRDYAIEALRTPYFLCGEYRLIFISRQLVRNVVSEWWHRNKSAQEIPLKYFYDKSIEYLFGPILNYHKSIGYKLARFKKR